MPFGVFKVWVCRDLGSSAFSLALRSALVLGVGTFVLGITSWGHLLGCSLEDRDVGVVNDEQCFTAARSDGTCRQVLFYLSSGRVTRRVLVVTV